MLKRPDGFCLKSRERGHDLFRGAMSVMMGREVCVTGIWVGGDLVIQERELRQTWVRQQVQREK